MQVFLSICIPSYNRPNVLLRLLQSKDCVDADIEIIICEDNSPKRNDIVEKVAQFKEESIINTLLFGNTCSFFRKKYFRICFRKSPVKYEINQGWNEKIHLKRISQRYFANQFSYLTQARFFNTTRTMDDRQVEMICIGDD